MLSKEQHQWTQTFIGVRFEPHAGGQAESGAGHRGQRRHEAADQGHGAAASGADGLGPMLPDCKVVHGRVPGPRHHVLCTTHGHVVDEQKRMIIAPTLAEYIARNGPAAAPAHHAQGPASHSGAGRAHPAAAAPAAPANDGPRAPDRLMSLCAKALFDASEMSLRTVSVMENLEKVRDECRPQAVDLMGSVHALQAVYDALLFSQANQYGAGHAADRALVASQCEVAADAIRQIESVNHFGPFRDALLVKIHEVEQRSPGGMDSKGLSDTLRALDGDYHPMIASASRAKSALSDAAREAAAGLRQGP